MVLSSDGTFPDKAALVMDALHASSSSSSSASAAPASERSPGAALFSLPCCSLQLLAPLAASPSCSPASGGAAKGQSAAPSKGQGSAAAEAGLAPGVSSGKLQGRATLSGEVHGVAFVHKRDTVGKALADLKVRLLRSADRGETVGVAEGVKVCSALAPSGPVSHAPLLTLLPLPTAHFLAKTTGPSG